MAANKIIACLVLMLSLSIVAYAANWFGLRDLLLPFINRSSSIEEESSTIGLSGYQGSEEWQALAEWQEFVSQYDPDGIIYQNIDGRLDSSFARYSCYLVYSQETAEEIDRITEKYGLALHTTSYDLQEHPELVETLGISLEITVDIILICMRTVLSRWKERFNLQIPEHGILCFCVL